MYVQKYAIHFRCSSIITQQQQIQTQINNYINLEKEQHNDGGLY